MKISEMITDRYKLRIPQTVYYELLADVQEAEEEQEPCDKYIKEIDHLRKYIYKLETQIVEQEPRKGHWIFDGDCLICSKCKKAYSFSGSNFCPNCGVDMREVEGGRKME